MTLAFSIANYNDRPIPTHTECFLLTDVTEVDPFTLGGNIRSTRILKGLKLREVADRVGCSESMLSKVENGKITPSLRLLHKVASSFGTTVPALLSARDDMHIVSRKGKRPTLTIDAAGSHVERLVSPDGDHLLEGHLHIIAPGGGSEGVVTHEGEEVGYVVDGQLELAVGHETFLLGAGDSFSFRSEIAHRYRNPGKKSTRVVWVSTPGRRSDNPASFTNRNQNRKPR